MTKEQVIIRIKHNSMYKDDRETADYIIKALEQNTVSQETYDSEYLARKQAEQKLYEIEQNTCEDCVDRNHVIATISQHHFDKDKDNFDLLIHNLCKEINELPPVTPTRKSGLHWIERFNNESMWLECPHCHMDSIAAYNYCPNCGASFKEEKRGNSDGSN